MKVMLQTPASPPKSMGELGAGARPATAPQLWSELNRSLNRVPPGAPLGLAAALRPGAPLSPLLTIGLPSQPFSGALTQHAAGLATSISDLIGDDTISTFLASCPTIPTPFGPTPADLTAPLPATPGAPYERAGAALDFAANMLQPYLHKPVVVVPYGSAALTFTSPDATALEGVGDAFKAGSMWSAITADMVGKELSFQKDWPRLLAASLFTLSAFGKISGMPNAQWIGYAAASVNIVDMISNLRKDALGISKR